MGHLCFLLLRERKNKFMLLEYSEVRDYYICRVLRTENSIIPKPDWSFDSTAEPEKLYIARYAPAFLARL